MAQMLTKTFRTSSTEAILVLANMIPIDYRVQEVAAVRALELQWAHKLLERALFPHLVYL